MLLAIKTLKVRGAFLLVLSHSYNGRFIFLVKIVGFFSHFVVVCFARVCREVVCKAIQIDKATCRRMIDHYITKLQERLT